MFWGERHENAPHSWRTGALCGVRMGKVGVCGWFGRRRVGRALLGASVENPRHGFQAPGCTTARLEGLVVQRSGDLAHGGPFVPQPADLGERGLLDRRRNISSREPS
jgi:hypothetical protein